MRRLQVLTNKELATLLLMRNRLLTTWLADHKGSTYISQEPWKGDMCTDYNESKTYSLPVMECLAELEARIAPKWDGDKPYLAEAAEAKEE